jgi:hypothetical protein
MDQRERHRILRQAVSYSVMKFYARLSENKPCIMEKNYGHVHPWIFMKSLRERIVDTQSSTL